ncbi:hypothetical protein [Xanthobacter autotrophicus]|uniref:hypothetical protein n=1 Tax=Xanthobacter autotrophicus TaxID=280 RepID=UPI003726BE9D
MAKKKPTEPAEEFAAVSEGEAILSAAQAGALAAPPEPDDVQPERLVPTEGDPDFNDPSLDGQAIVEAALARQQVEG